MTYTAFPAWAGHQFIFVKEPAEQKPQHTSFCMRAIPQEHQDSLQESEKDFRGGRLSIP
jgi:hypothetical protein